jgi:hypothetical protein
MRRFFFLSAFAFVACVGGDDSVAQDGGAETGTDGTVVSDGSAETSSDASSMDVEADAPRPVPKAVGDFDWAGVADGTGDGPIAYDAQGNLFFAFRFYYPITFNATQYTSAGTYDVILSKWDPSGKIIWARQYGGASDDEILALAVDPAGDVYATFLAASPTFSFGFGNNVTFAHVGTYTDGFVVKLKGSNGDGVWLANYTKPNEQYLACGQLAYGGGKLGVSCFSYQGMSLVKASDDTPLTLSCLECGGTNSQYNNIYVASLDPTSGKANWGNIVAADNQTTATSIAVDSKGAVDMGFSSFGTIVHDPTNSVNWTYAGVKGSIALIVKLAGTNGAGIWFKQFTDGTTNNNNQTEPGGVAVDGNDDVVFGGQLYGTVPFGTYTLKSAGMADAFIAKLKGGFGDVIWAQSFGGTLDDHGASVGVDAWNEVLVANDCQSANGKLGTLAFPAVPASHQGSCIGKLDSSGNALWATGIVSSSTSLGLLPYAGVAVDPSVGDVTVVGEYQGTVDLGDGNPYTSKSAEEAIYIVTHNP